VSVRALSPPGTLNEQSRLQGRSGHLASTRPEIVLSQPGLGRLGARISRFGDDHDRYVSAKPQNYAGTSPITRPRAKEDRAAVSSTTTGCRRVDDQAFASLA